MTAQPDGCPIDYVAVRSEADAWMEAFGWSEAELRRRLLRRWRPGDLPDMRIVLPSSLLPGFLFDLDFEPQSRDQYWIWGYVRLLPRRYIRRSETAPWTLATNVYEAGVYDLDADEIVAAVVFGCFPGVACDVVEALAPDAIAALERRRGKEYKEQAALRRQLARLLLPRLPLMRDDCVGQRHGTAFVGRCEWAAHIAEVT